MNSRFKFRVWNPDIKSYDDNPQYNVSILIDQQEGMILSPFHNNIIEMCTGLKDKNGNLIYEGDVVYDSVYENNFVVSWDSDRTGYVLSANNTNHIDYLSKILIERHNLKIVGNIHEQPEQKDIK